MSELTPDDYGWLYNLALSRVRKQRRRLDNYEAREGDDTYHFDTLAINLTRMENTLERLKPLCPNRWEWKNEEIGHHPQPAQEVGSDTGSYGGIRLGSGEGGDG